MTVPRKYRYLSISIVNMSNHIRDKQSATNKFPSDKPQTKG